MSQSNVPCRFDVHNFLVDVVDDLAEVPENITSLSKILGSSGHPRLLYAARLLERRARLGGLLEEGARRAGSDLAREQL